MRISLYTAEYRSQLSPEIVRLLLEQLPPTIQRKALRYHRWQDSYGCIFGHNLLRIALKKMNFAGGLDELQYSREQKPFLPVGPHFNISHSASRVVCIVSEEGRVGIDLEYIAEEVSLDPFRSQFTPAEWFAIRSANVPREIFYQFWTAKESVIKADGRGLGIPLHEVDVSNYQTVLLDHKVWRLTRLPFFDGYECHFSVEDWSVKDVPVLGNWSGRNFDFEFCEVIPTDIAT